MSNYCYYCCKNNCVALGIIASILIGIITAFLSLTDVITVTPVFLWVLFGIAIGYLALILVTSTRIEPSRFHSCVHPILSALLVGILGTVLTAVILLGISFAEISILDSILTGLLLAFFFLALTMTACLIQYLVRYDGY